MPPKRIRPIVIAIFQQADKILVTEMTIDGKLCYRPLGGGIEMGEYAIDALKREMMEELSAEIHNIHLRSVLENIFTMYGQLGHEVVFVFDADFVDLAFYTKETIVGYEVELDEEFTNRWMPLNVFRQPDAPPLYPDGLLEILTPTSR